MTSKGSERRIVIMGAAGRDFHMDAVVSGTPIDLGGLISVPQPIVRARYAFADVSEPGLGVLVDRAIEQARGTKED